MKTRGDPRPGTDDLGGSSDSSASNRHPKHIILASNRGPVQHYVGGDGKLKRRCTAGGLATALTSLSTDCSLTWIANASSEPDRYFALLGDVCRVDQNKTLRQLAPSKDAYKLYYGMFCNPVLWFLQHGLWDRLQRRLTEEDLLHGWEDGYLPVNQSFAETIVEELDREANGGRVMLHDYHLYAAPLFIRNLRPDVTLQHFIHIPWPAPDVWSKLPRPVVESICSGLLACDSVALQTRRDVENFVMTCQSYVEAVQYDDNAGLLLCKERETRVWANPVSVDIWDLRSQLAAHEAQTLRAKLASRSGVRTLVRVDRLDPTKNIVAGFRAYARLLERHPEWRERVRFLAFLVPSRTDIPEYQSYRDEVVAAVDEVNTRFGTRTWTPVSVFLEHNRLQALIGLSMYDVLLVNPLRDGMNLVSKEGPVLNDRDGVLVLSSHAGSFAELSNGALPVQPGDIEGTAHALHAALSMPANERRERAQRLREAVVRHDLARWMRLLMDDITQRQGRAARPEDRATSESGQRA